VCDAPVFIAPDELLGFHPDATGRGSRLGGSMTTAMLRAQAGALRSPDRRPAGSRAVPRRPAPVLLERDLALQTMVGAVQAAAAGSGSVVLVSGEAGIGKTSVVRAFVEQAAGLARVLVGACDDLMTPRPLGPLRDAAAGGRAGRRRHEQP